MTPEQIANESAQRVQQFDDDALLAAEAFAFGLGDKYVEVRQADILRRLDERYGTTDASTGNDGSGT